MVIRGKKSTDFADDFTGTSRKRKWEFGAGSWCKEDFISGDSCPNLELGMMLQNKPEGASKMVLNLLRKESIFIPKLRICSRKSKWFKLSINGNLSRSFVPLVKLV
jgi:hypothetical protein